MLTRALGVGVVGLAAVLPWTTRFQFGAPTPDVAMLASPLFVFTLGALGLIALLVARDGDPWLGAFVAYTAAGAVATLSLAALEMAQWVAFGALLLWVVRTALPAAWHRATIAALIGIALGQVGYGAGQLLGYDVLWEGLAPLPMNLDRPVLLGTLGNPNYVAALVALITPLAPPRAAAILLLGLLATQSYLGLAAALLGLAVRSRGALRHRRRTQAIAALVLVGAGGAVWLIRGVQPLSAATRVSIWTLALGDSLVHAPVFGYGPGSWWVHVPGLQRKFWISGLEWFTWAHNELVQLQFEQGLVAVALLAGWLVYHRAMWRGPYAGSLAALAVTALGMFPLHLPVVAVPALIIIGLATPGYDRYGLHVPARVLRYA